MTVNVLLSGRLRLDGYGDRHPQSSDGTFALSLGASGTVRDVIRGMGVPLNQVAMTMLNGRKCEQARSLKPGDRVILIPQDVAALWRFLGTQNLGIESILDF